MNKCFFIGRITRDIELKYLPSGQAVAKTGFATSEKYKDKVTGNIVEKPMFIDITVWGKSAETFNQHCQKGHKIAIEGKLQLDQWDDKETGQKRSKHSISVESFEFLESKNQDEPKEPRQAQKQPSARKVEDIDDMDIPFNAANCADT